MLGQHTLDPGEETPLKVIYNTDGRPGPFEKRVFLKTNLPGRGIATVSITGTVRAAPAAKIEVRPRKIYLENSKNNTLIHQHVDVLNSGQASLVINKIYCLRQDNIQLQEQPLQIVIEPNRTMAIGFDFEPLHEDPFIDIVFFDTNARNARNGQYAIMLVKEADQGD